MVIVWTGIKQELRHEKTRNKAGQAPLQRFVKDTYGAVFASDDGGNGIPHAKKDDGKNRNLFFKKQCTDQTGQGKVDRRVEPLFFLFPEKPRKMLEGHFVAARPVQPDEIKDKKEQKEKNAQNNCIPVTQPVIISKGSPKKGKMPDLSVNLHKEVPLAQDMRQFPVVPEGTDDYFYRSL